MNSKKADIAQIKKYLQGELNASEQHRLEREALDDPFLQEAIDGYAQSSADPVAGLNELDQLLDKRVNQAEVRRLGIWPYLAAASVLVAVMVGYLVWPSGKQDSAQVAMNQQKTENAPANAAPATADTTIADALKVDKNTIASNKAPLSKHPRVEIRQAAPVANADVQQQPAPLAYEADAKSSIKTDSVKPAFGAATLARVKHPDTSKLKEITLQGYSAAKKPAAAPNQTLLSKVEGVKVTTPDSRIKGFIYDERGQPLPGVSVFVKDTKEAVQTDVNGKFSITANGAKTLNIAAIGYLSKQVVAGPNDSVKVALQDNTSSLSEVVVTRNLNPIKPDKRAHPRVGWKNYNQYLERRAIANEEIAEGTVKLSFTVGANGQLSNIQVVKSLNKAADNEAIYLLQNGPEWLPAADGKPKTITLKIRFKKQ